MGCRFFRIKPLRVWCYPIFIFAGACATVEKRDEPVVHEIRIEGSRHVSTSDLKSKILTSEETVLRPFERPYFDVNTWQGDLYRIERYYQARGYYQAKVLEDQIIPYRKNAVVLRVVVREGAPTKISQLQITGLETFDTATREEIEADLPLRVGDNFDEDEWAKLKEQIPTRLRELGYAEAVVEGHVDVDLETREAKIEVRVIPGLRYRFGNIFVATDVNPKVPTDRIIQQAEASIKRNSWYSETALTQAQTRIFRMGVFGAVKVNRGAPNRATATVPVVVEVREAPFHTLRAGFGAAVDQARNEGRVLGEYTNRNFYGGLRRLTLRSRVGYAFLPNIFVSTKNGVIFNATSEFEQPSFLHRSIRLLPVLQLERGLEPAYNYTGGKARLGLVWQPHPQFSISPSYNFEIYRLDQVTDQLQQTDTSKLLFGCPKICILSYLEQSIEWDRRDDRQEPKKGYFLGLGFQEGGIFLGGNFDYIRIQPEARYYLSVGREKRLTFAAKLKAGALISLYGHNTPIVTRFFSGGGNSMRGFNNRRLSPLSVTTRTIPNCKSTPENCIEVQTVPIGGNGLLEGSFETRYSFGDLVLAAFLDTGVVTPPNVLRDDLGLGSNRPVELRDLTHLYYAVGLGIRYRTIVGPIRFDVAYRMNIGPPLPVYFPGGQVLPNGQVLNVQNQGCISNIGRVPNPYAGVPEAACAFHISIGEAF